MNNKYYNHLRIQWIHKYDLKVIASECEAIQLILVLSAGFFQAKALRMTK